MPDMMSTGISGLRALQRALDTTSHNIANANTVGFKTARAEFADVFAKSLSGSGASPVGAGAALWDTPFSIVNRPGYVDSAVAAVTIWESPLRSASEVRVYLGGAFFTGPGAGMEFYGTPLVTYQALIVAHELAHVLDRIPRTDYPTNSKAIGDNLSNSQRVHRACF